MNQISGADLLAIRSQAASAKDYAGTCHANTDRLSQAYLALQVENLKLQGLIEEQKGTITALNMALGGDDSTSTENLIDSHERDPDNKGLILVTQELADGMRDVFPAAHRLALELECILLSCTDTCATAKWWDSANEALEQWREFCEDDEQPHISPLGMD
jgi:hypothetical protein